jgi:hypothetical protein
MLLQTAAVQMVIGYAMSAWSNMFVTKLAMFVTKLAGIVEKCQAEKMVKCNAQPWWLAGLGRFSAPTFFPKLTSVNMLALRLKLTCMASKM